MAEWKRFDKELPEHWPCPGREDLIAPVRSILIGRDDRIYYHRAGEATSTTYWQWWMYVSELPVDEPVLGEEIEKLWEHVMTLQSLSVRTQEAAVRFIEAIGFIREA